MELYNLLLLLLFVLLLTLLLSENELMDERSFLFERSSNSSISYNLLKLQDLQKSFFKIKSSYYKIDTFELL